MIYTIMSNEVLRIVLAHRPAIIYTILYTYAMRNNTRQNDDFHDV